MSYHLLITYSFLFRLNHPYIKSVHEMSELVVNRVVTFFHHSDLIYHLSPSGWRWRRAIRTAHAYTRKVIAERADAIGDDGVNKEGATTRRGKYIDFLDILLAAKVSSCFIYFCILTHVTLLLYMSITKPKVHMHERVRPHLELDLV